LEIVLRSAARRKMSVPSLAERLGHGPEDRLLIFDCAAGRERDLRPTRCRMARSCAPYDTENADLRAHDALCLTDPAVADLLDRHDIKRISFRELRALRRAG
jgi:hypothetical protein